MEWRGRDIRDIVKIATIGWFVCMSGRPVAMIIKDEKENRKVGLSVCHADACRLCKLVDRPEKHDER